MSGAKREKRSLTPLSKSKTSRIYARFMRFISVNVSGEFTTRSPLDEIIAVELAQWWGRGHGQKEATLCKRRVS